MAYHHSHMSKSRQQSREARVRINNDAWMIQATTEIRYVKEQQLRTTYYSILLNSAAILLFQIDVHIPSPIYSVLKWVSMVVLLVLLRLALHMHWDHFIALGEYRQGLDKLTGVDSRAISKHKKKRRNRLHDFLLLFLIGRRLPSSGEVVTAKDKLGSSKRYFALFTLLSIFSTIAAEVVIYFDS